MSKITNYYRELMISLTEKIQAGERDLAKLMQSAEKQLQESGDLSRLEILQISRSLQRDLEEFAHSYYESKNEVTDSVFMRVIKESIWQELADITDKTQLEWRELFKDVNHHGVYTSGEVVGLGNLVCEKCHYQISVYTPEILPLCPQCGHNQFSRRPFNP